MIRRIPVGRLTALLALVAGAWAITRGERGPAWRSLAPGVEFTTLRGEPFCRSGPAGIGVLRLDPARVRIRVRHYTQEPDARPLGIVEWQKRTSAIAVFNAGQYYPDLSYMGLLVAGGRTISRRIHPDFKAALVADPVAGGRNARVLDLDRDPLDPRRPAWREVAQSFMLFDADGAVRVRKSDRIANRTVVAQDQAGRLVVITSEGAYTLRDFAEVLKRAPLRLTLAMSMDGGHEAEMCIKSGKFQWASFGRWEKNSQTASIGSLVPLPAVIEVRAE